MATNDRLTLHNKLLLVFPDLTLYFTPPSTLILNRPCIVYENKVVNPIFSNNATYAVGTTFELTLMCNLPDVIGPKRMVESLPGSRHMRSYLQNDVQHHVYDVRIN